MNNENKNEFKLNSLGEGGIWICKSNDNIENGNYITSPDNLGYGENQNDDLLHNYIVGKATTDCPRYHCLELNENI